MYCLKPKAKEELIGYFSNTVGIVGSVIFMIGLIALLLVMTGVVLPSLGLFMGYVGILSWTTIFSLIVISTKRWLQSNIINCEG